MTEPRPQFTTDRILIVGGGIAALSAALALAPRPALLIAPEPLGEGASSAWAQGGIAAALGADDDPGQHLADTLRAGAGLVDAEVARAVTEAAPGRIAYLASLGAPFDRDRHGRFLMSREAAHGRARVVRVQGDRAGAAIMAVLIRAVTASAHVQVMTGLLATDLVLDQGRVAGLGVEGLGGLCVIVTPAVLLAGGGAAGLWAVTTNPPRIRGQMLGMAARAGAVIRDAEFLQFHPTAMDSGEDPVPLATEALRGEGATLIDREGRRFMPGIASEAELAPRDIVARAVFLQARAGQRPCLDTRAVLGPALANQFPTVAAACRRAGINPVVQPIPVTAAAHYHMGGIATDLSGRSSLPGLWAAGEAACTGLHGANRLASNGVLEALVLGHRAGKDLAEQTSRKTVPLLQLSPQGRPQPVAADTIATLRQTMTRDVGVVRDAAGLIRALQLFAHLDRPGQPPALANMIAAATVIAASALARRESRGAQFRADAPQADPGQARSIRTTLSKARQSPAPVAPDQMEAPT